MDTLKLCESDYRFMTVVWEHQPVTSGALVELCNEALGWKKSTTYTVLKKLCEQGLFQNEGGVVTAPVSREEFYALQSEKFVEEAFSGSLPAFIAAFTKRKALSELEIAEIRRMIDEKREG